MSDTTSADAQAAGAQSQADTVDTTQGKTPDPKTVNDLPEWAQREIREARKEAAGFRTQLQKIEDRDKTDLQKATDRAAELERLHGETVTQLQQERAERLVTAAAGKANAVRPDAVYRLIRDTLEYEDGKPTNVDAAIKAARTEYPELFRSAAGSGDGGKGADTPKDKNQQLNDFIRQAAAR